MKNRALLKVEMLEDRQTPSSSGVAWGVPWPDPTHLTVSFAPDNTDIGGTPSNLFSHLNRMAAPAVWEREILRAIQTWAVNGNINVSVVSDTGVPFGAIGAVEGDTRMGDIRIGAKPLPSNTIATGSPFSWTGTSWSGDIILNSNASFGMGGEGQYDLFTVAMHEAGHSFGFPDQTTTPSSILYQQYTGPRTGLSSQDVGSLQALYGARAADSINNSTMASATPISSTTYQADGDISTTGDVDYYKFSVPLLALPFVNFAVTVQTSHISSLVSGLSIYNWAGQLVGTAAATDPMNGNLTIQMNWSLPLSTYYLRIASKSRDVFGIGGYHVSLGFSTLTGIITPILAPAFTFISNLANDTLSAASILPLRWGNSTDARFQYVYTANLSRQSDVDYYRIQAPASSSGTPQVMIGMVWAMDATNPLQPRINVFDAFGNPVPVQILTNGAGAYTIQVANDTPNAVYYLRICPLNPNGPNTTGNYFLGVNFNNEEPVTLQNFTANTLQNAAAVADTMTIGQSALFHFALSAATTTGGTSEGVLMTIVNSRNQIVLSMTNMDSQPTSTAVVYLLADTYTVRYQAIGPNAGLLYPINYWLTGEILSDPQGTYIDDTSGSGGSSPPSYVYSTSSNSSPPPSKTYYY